MKRNRQVGSISEFEKSLVEVVTEWEVRSTTTAHFLLRRTDRNIYARAM